MAGPNDIAVVHARDPRRETILEALSSWTVEVHDDATELALGCSARLILTDLEGLRVLRSVPGAARPIVAVGTAEEAQDALDAGAAEFVPWPTSALWLTRRLAMFLDGRLGPGRVVLDPRRTTSFVHAVRNPLNVITLYAELLKMEAMSADALGSVGRLVRAAKRVDALVGELETLLYLESGDASVQVRPVELGELVQIVLAELKYDIEDKPLKVSLSLAEAGTMVRADPDLTRRALQAVLGRVTKLCLGHAEIEIHTTAAPPTITIIAPIEPIPADRVDAFTHPATELDARESLGGVGVGLSFAERAISVMSGGVVHDVDAEGRAMTRLIFVPV